MHVILFQDTTTTIHILSIRTDEISLRKACQLSQAPPYARAYDVNNKNRVRLRRAHRAISLLSFMDRNKVPRVEGRLVLAESRQHCLAVAAYGFVSQRRRESCWQSRHLQREV